MVKYSVEDVRRVMDRSSHVRNMAVIAHVDHGKSTLTDSLLCAAGLISKKHAGEQRYMDDRKDEQERCITIKSSSVALCFNVRLGDSGATTLVDETAEANAPQTERFLVNLIDCPGHVDFSSEVTAALRVTDGALVVIDCVEGVCVQTETVLRQALSERIKPVLMLNKLDRALQELRMDYEAAYQALSKAIESANALIQDNNPTGDMTADWTVSPSNGTVAFGSGLQGWAFTVPQFARLYAKKLNVEPAKLQKWLWGDNFYDSETQRWTTSPVSASGKPLERGFCQFVLKPIYQLFEAVEKSTAATEAERSTSRLDNILQSLSVRLTPEERRETEGQRKELWKRVMQKFLPAADALLDLIVNHLPSPTQAQPYRCTVLYDGPQDDRYAEAIKSCDPNGPLMLFVSKMLPQHNGSRFIAFGRVFAGTVSGGQRVRIMGANYHKKDVNGTTTESDVHICTIQQTHIMMGRNSDPISEVPCGSTVGLIGVDKYLVKSGTLTGSDCVDAYPLRNMRYSVAPVVQRAVSPKNPADLPKLVEGLKRLCKSDQLVECFSTEAGEHIIAGAGELHLEICIKDLCEIYAAGVEVNISEPVVAFRETVTTTSSQISLSVSPNRHNRLYAVAAPLTTDSEESTSNPLAAAVDLETISKKVAGNNKLERDEKVAVLTEKYGWDKETCRRIWFFGPTAGGSNSSSSSSSVSGGTNILVDETKGVQYVNEIKDSVVAAFEWATKDGVLCEEGVFGVKYSILDAVLHADSIHRGGGQIIPSARRVFYASQLTASPRLVEPVFLVDITAPATVTGSVYSVLSRRRGIVFNEEHNYTTSADIVSLKAHLPVVDSFGFTSDLRAATGGQAFPQLQFSHWSILPGDPLANGSAAADPASARAASFVQATRLRKGLNAAVPTLDRFVDKI